MRGIHSSAVLPQSCKEMSDMAQHDLSTLPLVIFTRIPMRQDRIRKLVALSRHVARWNGNQRGLRPINLITDDFVLARDALLHADFTYAQKQPTLSADNSGLFWAHSGVLWVRPYEERSGANVRTLAHEMAHAATLGHHHRGWRRMYALLLPLWWRALRPWDEFGINLRFELHHVTKHYAGQRMDLVRRREEVNSHLVASNRSLDRWAATIDEDPTFSRDQLVSYDPTT